MRDEGGDRRGEEWENGWGKGGICIIALIGGMNAPVWRHA